MSTGPRWRRRLLLVAASAAASFLLAEVALRALDPWLHLSDEVQGFDAHAIWHHQRRPHLDVAFTLRDGSPYRFRTNGLGLHDPRELTADKPPGTRRILVLGDSFTEGYHRENSVAGRLEARLAATGGGRAEVFNAGQSSYSPLLHAVRLEHQWLGLAPDAVVMNVDLTDVYDDYWRYRPRAVLAADGTPDRVPETWVGLKGALTPLLDVSYVGRLLARTWKKTPRTGGDGAPPPLAEHVFGYHIPGAAPPDADEAFAYCLGNIARVIERCKAAGIAIVVTTYPHRQQLEPDAKGRLWHRGFSKRIEAQCGEHGVPFFSAYDALRAAKDGGRPLYWRDDMHMTPHGQRIWADAVAAFCVGALERRAGAPAAPR